MPSIVVRGIDHATAMRLKDMAEQKGISREAYIRQVLQSHAVIAEINDIENKYDTLVSKLISTQDILADVLERNNELLEKIMEEETK